MPAARFVTVRHPVTGGVARVRESSLPTWRRRGWEPYTPPAETTTPAESPSPSGAAAAPSVTSTRPGPRPGRGEGSPPTAADRPEPLEERNDD